MLDGRALPDAGPIDPPPSDPPADPGPSNPALQPGDWYSLDGTTDRSQNGTWLGVDDNGIVWVVANVASDAPQAGAIGYVNTSASSQPPQLPVPVLPPQAPLTPQQTPLPFGALGGGAGIQPFGPPPNPQDTPITPLFTYRVIPNPNGDDTYEYRIKPFGPNGGTIVIRQISDGRGGWITDSYIVPAPPATSSVE